MWKMAQNSTSFYCHSFQKSITLSVIHLVLCIEIVILKLDIAGIVNEGLLVCKVLHSLRKIPVLIFF